MTFDIKKLPKASFEGVEFAYQSSSIEGGRKTATIEYINTRKRDIQDLGGLQKIYNIKAITDNNINYNQRNKLIEALDKAGNGILVHPEYNKKTVKCINYSLIDDITKLGATEFEIVFEEIEDKALLAKDKSNINKITKLKNSIRESLQGITSSQWVKDTRQTIGKTKASFEGYISSLQQVQSQISQAGQTVNNFSTYINEAITDVGRLIRTPQDLAQSFNTGFSNLNGAFSRSQDLFNNISLLYNFTGEEVGGNSNASKIGQNNKKLIENEVNINSLIIGYEAGASIEYKTIEELNKNVEILENAYSSIQKNTPSSILRDLQDIRIEFNNIVNNLSISLPRISNFTTNNISLNILCYKLYGNLDLKEDLKNINNIIDTSNVEGTIKIFSNV